MSALIGMRFSPVQGCSQRFDGLGNPAACSEVLFSLHTLGRISGVLHFTFEVAKATARFDLKNFVSSLMNKAKLRSYVPQACKDFIAAVTARANLLGLSDKAGTLEVGAAQPKVTWR